MRLKSIPHNAVLYTSNGDFMYKRIRDLREDNDLTQREIAAVLNCSQVSYSHYEIGRRDIPLEFLIKLSDFYDVSVDYILGLTDVKQKYPRQSAKR